MNTIEQRNSYAATILRIALGIMFLAHAYLKIAVFTPAGSVGFFESIGLPGFLAYATIGAEVLGGILLIAGYYTRYVAALLLPLLIGSILFVHSGNGWLFSNEGGGWEYPLFLTVAAVVSSLLGNGAFALQNMFAPKKKAA